MALTEIISTTAILSLLFTLITAIYRLYLHPLRHIPGPKIAALTWWYEFYYDVVQSGQYVFKIQELHKQYGPIVRITPDELHISDPGFLDTIYAPASSRRHKYPYQLSTLRVPGGGGTTPHHDVHKKRRESLTPFFSKRNVMALEPVIRKKVEQLCQVISEHVERKTVLNLSDVFFGFSNDVVTNFLFAHKVDVLGNEKEAAVLRTNSHNLLQGIHMNKHFPWIPDFLESLPLAISKPIMPPGLIDMLDLFERARSELLSIMKSKAAGEKPDGKESVYSGVLDNPNLPLQEKSLLRLEQEGALLVLAGTESPAKTLTVIFCHLLSNSKILSKLRDELSTVPGNATWTELERLPYLIAIIEEGNRLAFGVTARMARIAEETLTYTPSSFVETQSTTATKSYAIPSGTPVSTTTLSAHTNESLFPDPFTFDPDRWLGATGRERKKYQMAFGKGSRKCLGMELTRAELCLVVAALVKRFEMKLWETDVSEVAYVMDYHVSMPESGKKGTRVTVEGRQD